MYFAELKGMNKCDADKAIKEWAEKLNVEEYMQMPAEKLSKGNQQKIQFMTAVIHNPELVVLDEPFSGLDPVNTEFCSDILILNKGKTVLKGNLREIKDGYKANRVQIEVNKPITEYINNIGLEIENERNNDYTVKINNEEQAHELLKELVKSEVIVNKFEITKPTLNDIYQVLLQQNMLHMHYYMH